jgi:hypothetical protein
VPSLPEKKRTYSNTESKVIEIIYSYAELFPSYLQKNSLNSEADDSESE